MDHSRPTSTIDVTAEHELPVSVGPCTEKVFEERMFEKYGPIIADEVLARILGFASQVTFRRAIAQGKISLHLFQIGTARTRFALTQDVSRLILAARRMSCRANCFEISEEYNSTS